MVRNAVGAWPTAGVGAHELHPTRVDASAILPRGMDLQGIWQRPRVLSEDGLRRARRARYKTFNWGTSEEFKVRAADLEERVDPSACWSTSVVFFVEPADLRKSSHADPRSWITTAPTAGYGRGCSSQSSINSGRTT